MAHIFIVYRRKPARTQSAEAPGILVGDLGIGGLRSVEKVKGVASK